MSYMLSILEGSNKKSDVGAIKPGGVRCLKTGFSKAFWVFLVLINISAIAGLQAQTITSASYFDTNSDGNIDEVLITTDQPINDLTIVLTDFVFEGVNPTAVATGGTLGNTSDPDTPDDNLVTFDVSITGTEALLTATFATGNLQNLSATDFLANTDITRIDLALPVFLSATAVSDVLIQLQYSEVVTPTFMNAGDWTATGITSGGASQNLGDNSIVDLAVSSIGNTGFSASDFALVINDDANDRIADAAGNLAADISGEAIDDGQLPVFLSAIQFDTNGDGNVDEIVIEMSEDFDNATLDVNDFGLSSGTISSVSDDGAGTDNTTDGTSDEFFTLEVSVTGTAPVTVDYTSDGLLVALEDVNGIGAADN
ncbi:MAG: hypothetical protein AAFQ94_30685, partial [Bacteroidota bacterium]